MRIHTFRSGFISLRVVMNDSISCRVSFIAPYLLSGLLL